MSEHDSPHLHQGPAPPAAQALAQELDAALSAEDSYPLVVAARKAVNFLRTLPAPVASGVHEWDDGKKFGFVCCKLCGMVQRSDGGNKPCKGPGRLRPIETPHASGVEREAPRKAWRDMRRTPRQLSPFEFAFAIRQQDDLDQATQLVEQRDAVTPIPTVASGVAERAKAVGDLLWQIGKLQDMWGTSLQSAPVFVKLASGEELPVVASGCSASSEHPARIVLTAAGLSLTTSLPRVCPQCGNEHPEHHACTPATTSLPRRSEAGALAKRLRSLAENEDLSDLDDCEAAADLIERQESTIEALEAEVKRLKDGAAYKAVYDRMVAAETKWGLAEQRAERAGREAYVIAHTVKSRLPAGQDTYRHGWYDACLETMKKLIEHFGDPQGAASPRQATQGDEK